LSLTKRAGRTLSAIYLHVRAVSIAWAAVLLVANPVVSHAADAPAGAAQPATAQAQLTPPPTAPPAVAQPEDKDYVIGPGDTLQIYVWLHNDLSVTVPVRPDGKISTPLVEDLVAAGKTPFQLARDVEARLKEYVRTPQVNVLVTTTVNAYNQVKVIGQVKSPQSLPYRAGMTALDAVLAVGGLSEFAAGNRAILVRKEADGKETRTKLRLEDLIRKGKASANVGLRPGDLLIVPESMF
jgi:polysaccharide export outer membrane protein